MNDILWLLYAADVVQGLGAVSLIASLVCAGGAVLNLLIGSDTYNDGERSSRYSTARKFAIGALISMVIMALIPSRTTLYAAAALSAGEKAVNTEVGQKALNALETWLDKQSKKEDK